MKTSIYISILTLCSFSFLSAQGPLDGYLKGKKVLDLAPSYSYLTANTFLGAQQQKFDAPYRGSMLSLFAEYGLTEKVDLVATAATVFTANQSGLQDGGIYVKYRPVYAQFKKAGKLGILFGTGASFPLANYSPTATGAIGQKATSVPARLIIQWETPMGLFFNLTGGYNFRLDDLKEEDIALIRLQRPNYVPIDPVNYSTYLFKVGFPARFYYLDAWIEHQYSKGGADYVFNVRDLPQAYGVSYTQIGGTAYYSESGKLGFYLSGAYTINGRNTSQIMRITTGIVLKFK
jgi:hypothetical protein